MRFRYPVVRYANVRGLEPVTYVELILSRFDNDQDFVAEDAAPRQPAALASASKRLSFPGLSLDSSVLRRA
ncbi:MAG: hypothetical protein ABR517_06095 [Thermoanaerobaculia bacterium]